MTVVWGVVVVLAGVVTAFVMHGRGRLRSRDVAAREALQGVEVQLARRADLLSTLGATVSAYAGAGSPLRERVRQARAEVQEATSGGTVVDKARAAERLERAVSEVLAVAEDHHELRRSASFQQVRSQLADADAQLATAQRRYDATVADLNRAVVGLPWGLLAGFSGVGRRTFFAAPSVLETQRAVRF